MLDYVFNQSPFYDTDFTFFMDFDKVYLVDRNGEGCTVEDGNPKSIIFNIEAVTTDSSYVEGMTIKNGAYYLDINPANANVSLNKGQDKVANQIVSIDEQGTVAATDLNVNNNFDSETKQKFVRGTTATLYKNSLESDTVIIDLEKDNIDGSIFTPNKIFSISNYEEYDNYDGQYSMISREEVIKNINGNFSISTSVKLRKIGNITSLGGSIAEAASSMSNGVYSYITGGSSSNSTTTATSGSNTSTTTSDGNPYAGTKSTIVSSSKARKMLVAAGKKNIKIGNATSVKYKSVASSIFATRKNLNYKSSLPSKVIIARNPNDSLKRKFN